MGGATNWIGGLSLLAAALVPASVAGAAQPSSPASAEDCAPRNGLAFVCGLNRPEDMVAVPGTRWLVAGASDPGTPLALVDTVARQARPLFTPQTPSAWDRRLYPACDAPPPPAQFSNLGLSLRADGPGRFTLHVVSRQPRNTVEVFSLDAGGATPTLAWKGCIRLPGELKGNSVTTLPDRTVLVSVLEGLGGTAEAALQGRNTGAVFEAAPGAAVFQAIKGTELPTPNGLEVSPDGKEFYVVSSFRQTFFVFSRADPTAPPRQVRAPFNLDNLRWSGGRLIAAGSRYDEPHCGGLRRFVDGALWNLACHRGYEVAEIDPATLTWKSVAYAEPNPGLGGVATALILGDELWLSSVFSPRIGYRRLPGR